MQNVYKCKSGRIFGLENSTSEGIVDEECITDCDCPSISECKEFVSINYRTSTELLTKNS